MEEQDKTKVHFFKGLLVGGALGALAGIDGEKIFDDIRQAIPQGNRKITNKEIQDAINKALFDCNRGTFTPKPRSAPYVNDGKIVLQGIIEKGLYKTEAELIKASPVPIPDEPRLGQLLEYAAVYKREPHSNSIYHDVAAGLSVCD